MCVIPRLSVKEGPASSFVISPLPWARKSCTVCISPVPIMYTYYAAIPQRPRGLQAA